VIHIVRLFIFFILLNIHSFAQETKPDYALSIELQDLNGSKIYEYKLDSNTDDLKLDITQSQGNFSGKLKIKKKTTTLLFENGIKLLEKVVLEPKQETGLYCNYFIKLTISHNFQSKTIYIKDQYYYDKLLSYFNLINEQVTEPYKIPLAKFEFKKINSLQKTKELFVIHVNRNYRIHDTGNILYKNLYCDGTTGDTLIINFSTPKALQKSKTELVVLTKSLKDSLFTKTIRYINYFHFNHTSLPKNSNYENEYFTVSYQTGGVELDVELWNFKLTQLTDQSKDLIKFLNTSITPQEPFR
jgi:hypothetical protein